MRRLLAFAILLSGCGKEPGPAPTTPQAPVPISAPAESPRVAAEKLLVQAEAERAGAIYDRAEKAFAALIEADPKDEAAHEGRALARWRIALARGGSDPEVDKDLAAAGDRPRAKALKALVKLVDGARTSGGWEPLAPRILKSVFASALPDSAAFATDWVALVRRPDGELPQICEALAAAPDWPLAAGVRAALEGRDVPAPGNEGILWILAALRQAPGEAMKTLESATGPDQGILFQAQAMLLAAEGKFSEATGRMSVAPMPVLRAAANVAAGKPAAALENLGPEDTSPFARALRAAALLQTGTDASLTEMGKLLETTPIAWLRFERGLRRFAAGNPDGLLDLAESRAGGGMAGQAWYALCLWHSQNPKALEELKRVELGSLDPELATSVHEALAYASFADGQEDAGAAGFLEAAKKRPTRELFFKYATFLRGNRQWKALQSLGEMTARAIPADPEPWAARAEASFWLKEYDAAVETITFATGQKIDPKRLLRWRALAYEELGKFSEAHDDWDRLAELISHEGEAFAHRAWMKAKLGRWAEAKADAEQGVAKGIGGWSMALARFALAAEALHGPAEEGEEVDPAARKEGALEHLRLSVKTGAVEPSDLKAEGPFASLAGTEEWKKLVESSAEKQKELKEELKRGGVLGAMLDHGGGSVAVTGTVRTSGARQAGLVPGDIILEVEGRRVNHVPDVASILQGREAGQVVSLKVERELRPKLKLVQVRKVTLSTRHIFED